MSCERIPQTNRKGRGRIKYDNDDLSKLCFDKATNSENMCSKTDLQEDNQDVIQSPRNGEATSELEISTSTNFSLPAQTETVPYIAGETVDEWFKQRAESVSSIDLDAVMKNDVMDPTYLTENIGHNFLSNKDVDMTSIVTNICDIGLGLDIPTNASSSSRSKPVTETDCDNVILNSYSADQDTLLNDLDSSDLLDKDILVGNNEINNPHKVDLLHTVKLEKQSSSHHVTRQSEEQYTSVADSSAHTKQNKEFKAELWNGSEITDTQSSTENGKDKTNWESISATCKRNVDIDPEKEIDFPELNLITFQIDTNVSMCNINQPPDVQTNNKEILTSSITVDNGKAVLNNEKDIPPVSVDISRMKQLVLSTENDNLVKSVPCTSTSINNVTPISKNTVLPTLNPRSVLKSPLKPLNVTKKSSFLKPSGPSSSISQTKATDTWGETSDETQEGSKVAAPSKKAPAMAIIAISTDKSKNTTEIVINTPHGEQVFKGKTTDLMKATSGLWQKLDNNKIKRANQPLTISMMEPSSMLDSKEVLLYLSCNITPKLRLSSCNFIKELHMFWFSITVHFRAAFDASVLTGIV